MSTKGRFYLGLSLSVLLATSVSPARAQAGLAAAANAQKQAILDEQAKQAAANGGDQKADSGSSNSSGSSGSGSSSGSSSTGTKSDDNKGSDAKASDTKKEDTSAGDSDKKADSDKDDDKKKSDDDDDKKKADDDDDKKSDDKKAANSGKSDKTAAGDAYSPVKAAIFDMSSGNAKGAISTLKGVLEKNPKDAQAHYVLGAAYVMLRQYQDAINQYNTVLKLVPPASKMGQLASQGLKNLSK